MANKLTDQEILKLIEDFEKLSSDKQSEKRLGSGAFKDTYDIHPEYVLKRPQTDDTDNVRQMYDDYLSSKETSRHIPVEQPMLVLRDNKSPLHIQKKLKTTSGTLASLDAYEEINNKAKEFKNKLREQGIDPIFSDIGTNNMGMDESGVSKIHDPMGPIYPPDHPRSTPAFRAKQNALRRLKQMTGTKIYRAIPLIGPALAGAAALSSGDASAAIPLISEAESVGESPEDEAQMLAEIQAKKDYDKSPARLNRIKKLMSNR